jgi:hypothetical protein
MSTEQTTKWVIRAAKAAQFCKNSELRLFFKIQTLLQCVVPLER